MNPGPVLRSLILAILLPSSSVQASPAPDFGDIALNIARQIPSVATALTVFIFIMGVVMAVVGLMKIRKGAENPNDPSSRPHVGVIFIFVGSAMIAIPALIGTGVISVFGGGAPITDATGGFTFIP